MQAAAAGRAPPPVRLAPLVSAGSLTKLPPTPVGVGGELPSALQPSPYAQQARWRAAPGMVLPPNTGIPGGFYYNGAPPVPVGGSVGAAVAPPTEEEMSAMMARMRTVASLDSEEVVCVHQCI